MNVYDQIMIDDNGSTANRGFRKVFLEDELEPVR